MELQTMSDVKLVSRALTSGWLDGFEDRRRKAVHDLFDVVENSGDEEMRIKAFTALVRADAADLKRQEVVIKKQAADEAKRLRLLELIKHLPPGVIAKLTSANQTSIDSGSESEGCREESEIESIGSGPEDSIAEGNQ